LTASAFDAAGNTATATISVTVRNTPSDTTPPTVSITSPAAGSTVSGVVAVAANEIGSAALTDGGLRADRALGGTKTMAQYQFTCDSTTVACGSVMLTASAFDAAGNTATATISVTVRNTPSDTTPPTVSITSPVAGSTVSGVVAVAAN